MSALVTSEIFRLFLNTLTPDDKYSRRNMQTFWQQVQTTFSQNDPSLIITEISAFERDVFLSV